MLVRPIGYAQTTGYSKLYTKYNKAEVGRIISIGDNYIEFVTYEPSGFRRYRKWDKNSIYKIISLGGEVKFIDRLYSMSAEKERELEIVAERQIKLLNSSSIDLSKINEPTLQKWKIHLNNGKKIKNVRIDKIEGDFLLIESKKDMKAETTTSILISDIHKMSPRGIHPPVSVIPAFAITGVTGSIYGVRWVTKKAEKDNYGAFKEGGLDYIAWMAGFMVGIIAGFLVLDAYARFTQELAYSLENLTVSEKKDTINYFINHY